MVKVTMKIIGCWVDYDAVWQEEIAELKKNFEAAIEVIEGLTESIKTPHRLGLAEKPNPEWAELNNATEFLQTIKEKK